MRVSVRAIVFTVLVIIFQIIFFVLYITLTDYGPCGFPEWITNVSYTLNSSLFTSISGSSDITDTTTDTTSVASITVTSSDSLSTTATDTSVTTTDTGTATTTDTGTVTTTDTGTATTTDTGTITTTDTGTATTTDTGTATATTTPAPLKANKIRNNEFEIKYARHYPSPRYFLPPGSYIPPISTDPTKGPFYSTLPISVMIFAGLGLLFSAIRCNSFTGLGLTFFLACFAFEWAALVVPWLLQAAIGTFKPEEIYYNITTILDILYAVFSMIVAFGALAGRASRVQLLVVVIFGVVLYAVTRMVIVHYLVVLDLAGSMSVFTFGAFYGVSISWVINAFYKSDSSISNNNRRNYLYTGYVENLLSLLGSILIFVHWPYYCAYLIPVTMDMYIRAIVNTYFSMVSCVVMVYALSSVMTKSKRIDIGHIQKATLGGGVAVASVAPLYLHIWGAVLLGVLTGLFSIIFLNYIQRHTHKRYVYDSYSVMSAFGIPGIIGGIASAVMAALAVSPLDYTLNELFILYPAITGPNGVGAPRSDTVQGAYQFAGLLVAIGIGLVGGLLVGIIVRYLGPLEEDEAYTDDTMFTFPYETGNPCCPPATKCEKACKNAKD